MYEPNSAEQRLLEAACLEYDIDPALVHALVAVEQENERRIRRRGIYQLLRSVIEEHLGEISYDSE